MPLEHILFQKVFNLLSIVAVYSKHIAIYILFLHNYVDLAPHFLQ